MPRTGLLKRGSEGGEAAFIWTSCSGLYTVFRQELEVEQASPQWRVRGTGKHGLSYIFIIVGTHTDMNCYGGTSPTVVGTL